VTDRARWRDACAELDEATALPWVLLSGGVDDATVRATGRDRAAKPGERRARRALGLGGLPRRTPEPERTATLMSAGRARLSRLTGRVIEEHGGRWERALGGGPLARDARRGLVRDDVSGSATRESTCSSSAT
jgi:hypothetical protein